MLFCLAGEDFARGEPGWQELVELDLDRFKLDGLVVSAELSRMMVSNRPEERFGAPHL